LIFTQDESKTTEWSLTSPYACITTETGGDLWWSADFTEGSYKVKSVKLLNDNVNSEYLSRVYIWVDDVKCNWTGWTYDSGYEGTWTTYDCDSDGDGIVGSKIELRRDLNYENASLIFCGIQVFGVRDDLC
jgi:hypothetical protein